MDKKRVGISGENYAKAFLTKKGYLIIATNYRTRFGEIDIIAKEKDTLVFVEVKTRSSNKFGLPEEAVNYKKLEKIKMAAEIFVRNNKVNTKKMRIEVIALLVSLGKITSSKHIKVEF